MPTTRTKAKWVQVYSGWVLVPEGQKTALGHIWRPDKRHSYEAVMHDEMKFLRTRHETLADAQEHILSGLATRGTAVELNEGENE